MNRWVKTHWLDLVFGWTVVHALVFRFVPVPNPDAAELVYTELVYLACFLIGVIAGRAARSK